LLNLPSYSAHAGTYGRDSGLAAGSVAGVTKAIEFGLAKLIGLVINLFAKLIGLGGLSKKVQAIFKKITNVWIRQSINYLRNRRRLAGS
jgi:hypothetical protein